jgi:hypothetical protein
MLWLKAHCERKMINKQSRGMDLATEYFVAGALSIESS